MFQEMLLQERHIGEVYQKEIHQFQNLVIQERINMSLILKQVKNFLSKFYLEKLSGLETDAVGQLETLNCLVFLFVALQ